MTWGGEGAAVTCDDVTDWTGAMVAAAYLVACAGIVVAALCRLARTDDRTDPLVRWAFVGLLASAGVGGGTVLLGLRAPGWPDLMLAGAILAVQAVAARLWASGVPRAYLDSEVH